MANVYAAALEGIAQGEIVWTSDTIKAMLLETGGTFDVTDATINAVLASGGSEFDADSGYARQTLGTKTCQLDGNVVEFGSANVVFTDVDSADTAVAMVIYKEVTSDADNIPIAFCDFTDEVFTDNNLKTLTVACPATGWLNLQNS